MSLELIMQFRPIILFICFICALGGLKIILSFFPKEMKHQWIKSVTGLIYGCIFLLILDTPLYEVETIPLGKNENGEFFTNTDVPWACQDEPLDYMVFYNFETGNGMHFNPCYSHIWIDIIKNEDARLDYTHAYSLLRGKLFFDEYDGSMEFKLPEEAAKELAEIWNVHLNE